MKKTATIIINQTEDLKNFAIKFEGPNSYQTTVAMALAVLLTGVETFISSIPAEEPVADIKGVIYDDLNVRFTNVLNGIIPDEDLGLDFTAEAEAAINNEDEYIKLKFAEMQYLRILDAIEASDNAPVAVTLTDKGELTPLEPIENPDQDQN